MNKHITADGGTTRRSLLRAGVLASGTAAAVGLGPAAVASAAPGGCGAARSAGQVPGMHSAVDASHATPALAERLVRYFRRKSAQDLKGTMAHFARRPCTYIDATLGWDLGSWAEIHAFFAQYMPGWPAHSASYPVRILGDLRSAVVFFTDTAGLFGPSELRLAGAVDMQNGLITRQVDYWDGRHFGMENLASLQVPVDQFPADFGENTVRGSASAVMRGVVHDLVDALHWGDGAAAARLFAPDAVFEDAPAHIRIEGPRSIGDYLTATAELLPYVGSGAGVRHVLGNELGGGYEFTSASGPVPRGIVGLELDRWRQISRLPAVWDGSLVDDAVLLSLAEKALER